MKNYVLLNQFRGFQTTSTNSDKVFEEALSEQNIQNCIDILKNVKLSRPRTTINRKVGTKDSEVILNAGILVPFCHNEYKEPSVLLTQRSMNLTNHRGEVCFPGGLEEADDNNEVARTAVRETVEELGIEEQNIKIYGVLNPFPAVTGSLVYPVLGYIELNDIEFNFNKEEVESVFMVPLKNLCEEKNWRSTQWKAGWITPVYIDNRKHIPRVWGLTAGILYAVSAALLPNNFKFNYKILKFNLKQK